MLKNVVVTNKKFLYRFIGGILETAAWNAVTSILMALYPDKIASVMSWTQTFFGFGYMIGNNNHIVIIKLSEIILFIYRKN